MSDTGAVNTSPPETRPFTSWRGAIDWWYRPLIVAEPWLALGYLAVGALWAVTMVTVVAVMASITFGLVVVVVGLFLIVPTFSLVNAMVGVERSRAGWVGEPIDPRPLRASPDGSWFRSIAATLTDPERWRQVAVRRRLRDRRPTAVHPGAHALDRPPRVVLRDCVRRHVRRSGGHHCRAGAGRSGTEDHGRDRRRHPLVRRLVPRPGPDVRTSGPGR